MNELLEDLPLKHLFPTIGSTLFWVSASDHFENAAQPAVVLWIASQSVSPTPEQTPLPRHYFERGNRKCEEIRRENVSVMGGSGSPSECVLFAVLLTLSELPAFRNVESSVHSEWFPRETFPPKVGIGDSA